MSIPTETYEVIYDQYSNALSWMEGLGIKLGTGRTSHYERVLGHWKSAYSTASVDEGREIFPDFVSSMFEIFDFLSIHKAFRDVPDNQLASIAEKLQKAVTGPINAADETPASTAARNFLFEATVAARAHRPDNGVEAILDATSDTGIRVDGKKIWIECKRVTTLDGIEGNVRTASRQLEALLGREFDSDHRGVVAMDISKIVNNGDKIFVARNDSELLASVDRMMGRFIAEHSQLWQRTYERRHEKVIGTIIRVAFIASSEERNILVHASQWAMNPRIGIAAGDVQIQKHLATMLSSAT